MRPDGSLEYLGRTAFEVRIRGQRIEVEPIENALMGFESVEHALVHGLEDRDGHQTLVAYIVPDGGREPNVTELRHFLAERLPAYMVPARFVTLKALPLDANGKVDRGKLPAPDRLVPELHTRFVAPETAIEKAVREIWREVLDLSRINIGVHDSFFDLGGDSLTAMLVVSRVHHEFGVSASLTEFFDRPTVFDLAEHVANSR